MPPKGFRCVPWIRIDVQLERIQRYRKLESNWAENQEVWGSPSDRVDLASGCRSAVCVVSGRITFPEVPSPSELRCPTWPSIAWS